MYDVVFYSAYMKSDRYTCYNNFITFVACYAVHRNFTCIPAPAFCFVDFISIFDVAVSKCFTTLLASRYFYLIYQTCLYDCPSTS